MDLNDTIVALSSAAGPGVRAVVRLSGAESIRIVQAVFNSDQHFEPKQRCMIGGAIRLPGVHSPLPADLVVWPGPRTYTGQLMAELHTISCPPLLDLLMSELLNAGARAAGPGEFTLRAFLTGRRDLPRAEAVHAVISAASRDELNQALTQLAGGVTRPLEGLRDDLLNLLADVEAGLDFVDEDIQFVERVDVLNRLAKGMAQITILKRQLDQRAAAARPFRVVLVGEPNAGKSSLFNALGGSSAAIVSPIPGTTRDYLVKRIELDGIAVEIADTAGWAPAADDIERQAQDLAAAHARTADLLLLCSEKGTFIFSGKYECPLFWIATKCDLRRGDAGLAVSAVTGEGLPELRSAIAERARAREAGGLAPSYSRCRHHVDAALDSLRRAHAAALFDDPFEILALELRNALDALGALTGAVHTDELLDRVFSRFCIGK